MKMDVVALHCILLSGLKEGWRSVLRSRSQLGVVLVHPNSGDMALLVGPI